MELENRLSAFITLGKKIQNLQEEEIEEIAYEARNFNSWYTIESISASFKGLGNLLQENQIRNWIKSYHFKNAKPAKVGIIMAANIPLAGFHDLMCILLSGNSVYAKLSKEDPYLPKLINEWLLEIEPAFQENIVYPELLKEIDAVIATGSNNSGRYFDYYFSKIPHIIRKNRNSCAVLTGAETTKELGDLGKDIFTYFGLGCRNVSKLYVPENYNFELLFQSIEQYSSVFQHHKYCNNYDYIKSIYLINKVMHYDNGFLLLKEDNGYSSPISVLFYEFYADMKILKDRLIADQELIQCVVARDQNIAFSVPIGCAQFPEVQNYADNIDTMKFLENIKAS